MNDITILDGGMGKELRRIGAPFRQPEWSALALMEAPDKVIEAHANFIDAGAEMITTNNYAVVPYHLGDEVFLARGAELTATAGSLARRAADEARDANRTVRVAGSLAPLFGSYEPDLFDAERAPAMYRTIVESLDPSVDLWMAETLSLTAELDVIADAIRSLGSTHRLWAAFTLPDAFDGAALLRSGETVDDIVAAIIRNSDLIDAVLFNCALPEQITLGLATLSMALANADIDVRTGAYANGFPPTVRTGDSTANSVILERRTDLTVGKYADIVDDWIDHGATIVGGCCDMYPEHIAELANRHAS